MEGPLILLRSALPFCSSKKVYLDASQPFSFERPAVPRPSFPAACNSREDINCYSKIMYQVFTHKNLGNQSYLFILRYRIMFASNIGESSVHYKIL